MVGVPGRINHKDRQRTMCDVCDPRGIMARVAEKKLVARGVGEEEAERGWPKVLAVAETVRVEEREAVTREAVMERDGGEG